MKVYPGVSVGNLYASRKQRRGRHQVYAVILCAPRWNIGAMCRDASEQITRTRSHTQRGTDQLWLAREETLAFMRVLRCLQEAKIKFCDIVAQALV